MNTDTVHGTTQKTWNSTELKQAFSDLRNQINVLEQSMTDGKHIGPPLAALENQIDKLKRYAPQT